MLESIKRHRWDIAFVDGDWNFRFVSNLPEDRWFADPFILSVNDNEIVLLCEEFCYDINKGRIARLSIDRDSLSFLSYEIVLELPTHLSFPAILRSNGSVYVYPENSASGECCIYRYDDADRRFTKLGPLVEAPLTDAIVFGDYLLTTSLPVPNGKKLSIFARTGEFSFASCADVIFDDYVGRNAGNVFKDGRTFIRPAQICDGGYGYGLGISFQKIISWDGVPAFEEVYRKYPPSGYDGMHTYNTYGGFSVVDCRRFIHPILRAVCHKIRHPFSR